MQSEKSLTKYANSVELTNLKSTIILTLSDVMIKVKPSGSFLAWISSSPILSIRDIVLMENFYEDKSVMLHCPKLPQKGQRIYEQYMQAFKQQEEIVFLDQYFVDETCVHFLLYRNSKIQDCEIMLE